MTMYGAALPVALSATAVLAWPPRPLSARTRRGAPGASHPHPARRRAVLYAAATASVCLLLSVPPPVAGVAAVAAAVTALLAPTRSAAPDIREMRELAGVLDLVAAALDAGLGMERALAAVLDVAGGPPGAGACLTEVSALLSLGTEPAAAWRPAANEPALATLAAAATRSAVGGVRMAEAVREAAADLRAGCAKRAGQKAARAGVAMTAPLAVCFLPAFLCVGLAPVIIGLVGSLHLW